VRTSLEMIFTPWDINAKAIKYHQNSWENLLVLKSKMINKRISLQIDKIKDAELKV
jgi:hypothetical protein